MTAKQISDFEFEFIDDTYNRKKPLKHKKLIIALCIILVFIITLVSTFFIMVKVGEARLRESLVVDETLAGTGEEMDENAIYHNGKVYSYNENLINILLIGVDDKGVKNKTVQADALYLASVDTGTNQVRILSISRNTMCDIGVLGAEGDVVGTEHKQICLSYAYSKDDVKSSENCVHAVSELLYNMPINGYCTFRMKSIADAANAVGGVRVQIGPDAKDTVFAEKIGTTINLKGEDVLTYLRMRGESNAPRVERHKQFITGFVNSAKVAVKKDLALPLKLANKLSKDIVTDVDISSAVYLATEALNWKLSFLNIEGEYGIENELETFTVNEEALKELIVGNFYIAKQ